MRVKNILLCIAGFFFLTMGAIGLLLPIWPTTPFVLLAAGCFASTPSVYDRMMKIPFFNEYIRNYKDKKGLRPQTVAVSLVFLWGMLIFSMFKMSVPWAVPLLGTIGAAVTVHIILIARPKAK